MATADRMTAPGHGAPLEIPERGRVNVHTFGCQMNVHDSERMLGLFADRGWREVASAREADVVVLNTCSVREKAEQKLRSEVGRLGLLKRERPDLVICVAGCVAQQEGDRLIRGLPQIDVVVGPDNLAELPELVELAQSGSPPLTRASFDVDAPRFLGIHPKAGSSPSSAFVTTMKGCDERCSFCIVPTTRGPERYRSAESIVQEVKAWVEAGTREIVLLGQTVDSFRDPALEPPASDDPDESQFPVLLRKLAAEVPDLLRLRYTSPHPRHLTPSLIRAHAELDVLAKHVHMPVQSGSDRVLKRMIRRYRRDELLGRLDALRAARPGMTLSTDIIVGFPGETDADFEQTLTLLEAMQVVQVFAFKFSPRPDTPASRLADDVPEDLKAARLARVLELVEARTRAHLASLVGTRASVLVDGPSKTRAESPTMRRVQGRTERNEIVHLEVPASADTRGALIEVEVVTANKHSLVGLAAPSALAALPQRESTEPGSRTLPVLA